MKRFSNILFILDGITEQQAQVMSIVQNLARRNNASVRIVKLLEETIIDNVGKQFSDRIKGLIDLEYRHATQELEQALANPGWQGLSVDGELLLGKDFITVIRKVLEEEHDLVVKARSNIEPTDQFAMRLFRKCPCPVWIINAACKHRFKNIIGAVDLGITEKENWQLNKKIIELTHSLASIEQGEAYIVHAWHLEYEKSMRGPRFRVDDKEIEEMKQELVASRSSILSQLFDEADITIDADHIHLVEGPPGTVIREKLQQLQGDVLIMGTVARTGLPGLLLGNKAEEVLSQVQCTVLAVKPNGFMSPVTL
jgi:nucleotide-binding universal stress UspA family protein